MNPQPRRSSCVAFCGSYHHVSGIPRANFGFPCAGRPGEYYLTYTGLHQPAFCTLTLPEDGRYRIDVIDTWAMTVSPLPEPLSGAVTVELPGRPYAAVRARRV